MSRLNLDVNIGNVGKLGGIAPAGPARDVVPGEKFGQVLRNSITEVNRLQVDADKAINAALTGKTDNLAEVMTAVQKADLAFKTLLQIRNKLLDAYNEVRQMRI